MKKILSIVVIIIGLALTATQALSSLISRPTASSEPTTQPVKKAAVVPKAIPPRQAQSVNKTQEASEKEALQHLQALVQEEQQRLNQQTLAGRNTACNKKGNCWTFYSVKADNPAPKCNHCGVN